MSQVDPVVQGNMTRTRSVKLDKQTANCCCASTQGNDTHESLGNISSDTETGNSLTFFYTQM